MTPEDSLQSMSLDYLNLLINGQAFSDVTFSVEGRLVHAHRCILAARSLFFRKFFCGPETNVGLQEAIRMGQTISGLGSSARGGGVQVPVQQVIPVNSVGYEVFFLMLQFLYSGQVSVVPQKHEPRSNCGERGCWHTHCTSAVDLALHTLAAARSFGVEQLALITQKQLVSIVEKASIEDVMKVLLASKKHEMHQLWTACSHLVANSGLPSEVIAKHLPVDVVAKIEQLRLIACRSLMPSQLHLHRHDHVGRASASDLEDQRILRMRRALDSSDVELVKLMVMGEGLNLDQTLALHYAVENCSREVVKALLELGAADVNYPAGPLGKTPLHIAAEMVSPDMVAVLLDHHADPNVGTVDGINPLDVLRNLTSDFLFKGSIPGLTHIEPNKLRLCLELVQSAAMVISREEGNARSAAAAPDVPSSSSSSSAIYPRMSTEDHASTSSSGAATAVNNNSNLNLDSRIVYSNLPAQMGSEGDERRHRRKEGMINLDDAASMYHHHY